MSDSAFDPMKGVISDGGVVPPAVYTAKFRRADHLPATDGEPMTGKGKREWEGVRFSWEIAEGEHVGKIVSTDTGIANGVKSRFYQVACWLLGKSPAPGEPYDLSTCVDKRYLITLGNKSGKQWIEVTNAMLLPPK